MAIVSIVVEIQPLENVQCDIWQECGWYLPGERRLARRHQQRLEYQHGVISRVQVIRRARKPGQRRAETTP